MTSARHHQNLRLKYIHNLTKCCKILLTMSCAMYFVSCNSNNKSESAADIGQAKGDSTFNICYESVDQKDTVLLNASIHGDSVTGSLVYQFYEKDKNMGSILGTIKGDTLRGMYTFKSEGIESVREIVFLREDTLLREGYGNLTQKGDKVVFADLTQLKFDGLVLQKVKCP